MFLRYRKKLAGDQPQDLKLNAKMFAQNTGNIRLKKEKEILGLLGESHVQKPFM